MPNLPEADSDAASSRATALDVYFYGMTVLSTIHRCAEALALDGYGEIVESYLCPGGEAMNGAMLLSGLGHTAALGGPHFGAETQVVLRRYAERYGVDVSGVTFDPGYGGVRDVVVISGEQRTVLGWFGSYFAGPERRWSEPAEETIARARVIAIDPFFGASSLYAAELAQRHGKPYVTIDCEYAGLLHAGAAATLLSREYRARQYPGRPDEELFAEYAARSAGLSVFTSGKGPLRYGRGSAAWRSLLPFAVPVLSTLGAGDAFRAGVVFGVLHGFDDERTVRFAAGLSALQCTTLPIAEHIPSLGDVEAFLAARA